MTNIDKLMGARGEQLVYAAFRIDYNSLEDIRFEEVEEEENLWGDNSITEEERFSGAAKSPPPDHEDHDVKAGYQRKIIVGGAATRDEVTDYLDSEGIPYEVEDVTPTADEISAIEDYGASHGTEAVDALIWNDALNAATSVTDLKQVERGIHPDTGEEFKRPPDRRR